MFIEEDAIKKKEFFNIRLHAQTNSSGHLQTSRLNDEDKIYIWTDAS